MREPARRLALREAELALREGWGLPVLPEEEREPQSRRILPQRSQRERERERWLPFLPRLGFLPLTPSHCGGKGNPRAGRRVRRPGGATQMQTEETDELLLDLESEGQVARGVAAALRRCGAARI